MSVGMPDWASRRPRALGMLAVAPIAFSVDLATGALVGFLPPPVIVLSPSRFESVEQRDEYFAARRREHEANAAQVRQQMEQDCWRPRCAFERRQFEQAFAARLQRLEALRMTAMVRLQPP